MLTLRVASVTGNVSPDARSSGAAGPPGGQA